MQQECCKNRNTGMSETLDKEALTEWIRTTMKSMGKPKAYSYRVGVYHGMKRVLEKIESGEFTVGEGEKK
ncbi:hypothetical protein J25TS5_04320 [Paenibacillus faecis]|nr:hypothetical protein J25TS5_04320 [Paenibacillus faecis]